MQHRVVVSTVVSRWMHIPCRSLSKSASVIFPLVSTMIDPGDSAPSRGITHSPSIVSADASELLTSGNESVANKPTNATAAITVVHTYLARTDIAAFPGG